MWSWTEQQNLPDSFETVFEGLKFAKNYVVNHVREMSWVEWTIALVVGMTVYLKFRKTDRWPAEEVTSNRDEGQTIDSFDILNNNYTPDFQWTIPGITRNLNSVTFDLQSDTFRWTDFPLTSRVRLHLMGTRRIFISLYLLSRRENDRAAPALPLIPAVYYVVRDRSGTSDAAHRIRPFSHPFGTTFSYFSAAFGRLLEADKSALDQPMYTVDDRLHVDVFVETRAMAAAVHSFDGVLHWTMADVGRRRAAEERGLVEGAESAYFYTAPRGYRVRAQVRLVRSRWLDGVRVIMCFVTGLFDEDLDGNDAYITSVTLIHRTHPERNLTGRTDHNVSEYEIDIPVNVDNYIDNDRLFFKIVIVGL